MQKNIITSVIISAIIVLAGVGIYGYMSRQGFQEKGCTLEAMLCPDGSAVGRTGPDCEFAKCPSTSMDGQSGTISSFRECEAAGHPIMESYPRQCRADGRTFVEEIDNPVACTAEQRQAEICTKEYRPVCAKVNIQCIKAPCDPIKQTFGNICEACMNQLVESYLPGECI